ncbi:short-chain dehydrogenase/reductase [Streptomyces sp. Je 1-369]|uniref:short-chain dehydrogenase/reductase n=1 Tax=Streptomyces sp. Je 1-369 TaxID=2966192 RepID=UPI00228695DE|nr:short-chain dehydrogenase/reductase [Streptomyces sp. Je 1-369]WAL93097.1 short-chain dehydrogenase/reductase [Streptomyces sp. Je 1-369]WAL99883.1 short-chain dehydrogenase/reductase [Streptomyces sp. Je 1-369]
MKSPRTHRTRPGPLHHRTVVVTGAARGLGAALARELAHRDARLALLGLEQDALEQVAAALPAPALALPVDVTDPAALHTAARTVRERLGPPSVVIANAGIAQAGPLQSADPHAWRRVIEVNLTGSALTAQTFLPDLLHTRGYHLQIASLAALGAVPMLSAYCASKAGVEAFTHALRAETAHRGVAVGIAYLNWLDTGMLDEVDTYAALREPRALLPPCARRIRPLAPVAARLADAVEARRTAVYIPAWTRLAQAGRGLLPPLVTRLARARFHRRPPGEPIAQTGPLGAGGRAAHRPNRPPPH